MRRDIVVMGASSGGVDALRTIISGLPRDFPASVFVTLHTMPTGPGLLGEILARVSPLPVVSVKGEEAIRPGTVYVASPNLHLIILRGRVRSRFLPKENGTRPAIDPMFRSAAHSYSRRVIGVVLTGDLDDGTAGLGVVKDERGVTVVQDPDEAEHPDMPLSAIKAVGPDHVVPLAEIAPLLATLADTEVEGLSPVEEKDMEVGPRVVTCPGCGGVLREYHNDKVTWYQCMVGHRFTSESMMQHQNVAVEEHFWRVLAILKEKEEIARTLAMDAQTVAPSADPGFFLKQAEAAAEAQNRVHGILEELGPALFPDLPRQGERKASEGR